MNSNENQPIIKANNFMSKNKFFLGASAVILAIAGSFASKASTYAVNDYLTTGHCHRNIAVCAGSSGDCKKVLPGSITATVLTSTDGSCSGAISQTKN